MCPDYFFELSGELKDMCSAEAKKCIEAEAGQFEVKSEGPGYLIASFDERAVDPIADRISLTHKIGKHLCSFDPSDISSVDDIQLPEGSFAIRSRRFEGRMKDIDSQDLIRKIGAKLSKENPVRLKNPDLEVHMIMSDRVHLFLEVRDIDRNILETRKVGERPFFSPISLHPRYARALINLPHIVFADEPTGNLDRANADEVLELLLETKRIIGQTLIMVTHDMSIANRADRIFTMEDGRLTLTKGSH